MTGWIVASATAAALGAAGAGTLMSETQDKWPTWANDVEVASWFPGSGAGRTHFRGDG